MLLPRRTLFALPLLPATARAADDPRLTLPVPTEAPGLIPGVSDDPITRLVGSKLYQGLVAVAPGAVLKQSLAIGVEAAEDARRFTFRMRPGVTWHDGAPCTAADAAFSIGRFHPALSARTAPLLAGLTEARAVDPLTVTFRFAEPFAAFPWLADVLSLPIVPQHLHDRADGPPDPMPWRPVGTGPYRFLAWGRLVRFDGFAGPPPAIAELAFPLLPDPAARLALLQPGPALLATTAGDPALARLRQDPGLVVAGEQPPNLARIAALRVNTLAAPLDAQAVRQALSQAIDRAALVRDAWGGMARPALGPLASISRFAPDTSLLPPYDPRAASQALTAAGLRPDDEGVRASLTLLHPDAPPWPRAAARLAANLSQVGIHLTPTPLAADALAARLAQGDYQLAAITVEQLADPALDPGSPFPSGAEGDARRTAIADTARALVDAMGRIWLVEADIPTIRSRVVQIPGGLYGDFDDAVLT